MIVYHGSDVVVKRPKIINADRLLDFGEGFYTTTNKEQAIRWATKVSVRRKTNNKYISIYEIEETACKNILQIIEFKEPNIQWLDFICNCRSGKKIGINYDIVIGPVADDNVYTTVKLFETGVLDREESVKRLKVESLYNQVLFHTEKALEFCKYIDFIELGENENG